ncbi:unnamed protein product, partial [Musa banksii]
PPNVSSCSLALRSVQCCVLRDQNVFLPKQGRKASCNALLMICELQHAKLFFTRVHLRKKI